MIATNDDLARWKDQAKEYVDRFEMAMEESAKEGILCEIHDQDLMVLQYIMEMLLEERAKNQK